MSEEKGRIAREQRIWQGLVDAMRGGDQEEAERLAAEAEQVRDEEQDNAK